jgi:hypothetical protein
MAMQTNHPHNAVERRSLKSLWIGRIAAIVIAIIAAVGVMAGESWVLENAPPTQLACDIGQASDLTRALDSGFTAMAVISHASVE